MTPLGATILWSVIVTCVAVLAFVKLCNGRAGMTKAQYMQMRRKGGPPRTIPEPKKRRGRTINNPFPLADIPPMPGSSDNVPTREHRVKAKGSAGSPNVDIIAPSTPPIGCSQCRTKYQSFTLIGNDLFCGRCNELINIPEPYDEVSELKKAGMLGQVDEEEEEDKLQAWIDQEELKAYDNRDKEAIKKAELDKAKRFMVKTQTRQEGKSAATPAVKDFSTQIKKGDL